MPGLPSGPWAVMVVLATVSLPAADLDLGAPGILRLAVPEAWRTSGAYPTFTLERAGKPRANLLVTCLPWTKAGPLDTRELKGMCARTLDGMKASAAEKEVPLAPLQGPQASGWYYQVTDRSCKDAASGPRPGEWPICTQGVFAVGRFLVTFTVLSDAKRDAAVAEALEALGTCTLVPPRDLEDAVQGATRLKGQGALLSLDLRGFTRKDGEKIFHGQYGQLGCYAAPRSGLTLSILLDDLQGRSLVDLERAGRGQARGFLKLAPGGVVRSEPVEAPAGHLITFPAVLPDEPKVVTQQWYFETIHRGRWLELHFSKLLGQGEDPAALHAEVLRIVRSIRPR